MPRAANHLIVALAAGAALFSNCLAAQEPRALILPEQRRIEVRAPEQFRPVPLPVIPAPPTVTAQLPQNADWQLSIDDAIRISLANSDVVRILAGNSAVSSGSTIYDPAINNTQIDAARGRFDPVLRNNTNWNQTDRPGAIFNPTPSPASVLVGNQAEGFNSTSGISKQFLTGATLDANVNVNRSDNRAGIFPLNPSTTNTTELALTQPLLSGAGYRANIAPIMIARLNTERSFFQLKGSVQNLVRSVIEAYWNVEFAQIDVWVREQQVAQGKEAFELAEAKLSAGLEIDEGDVMQARVSYENFRASLIGAQADLLQQEAALRNLLGIPPADGRRLVPATPLSVLKLRTEWELIRTLAETYRPDLIELKLILDADAQQLLLSRNQAQPQLDAVTLYRWNGIDGKTPDGFRLVGDSADYQEWQAGVNFSVPLGLRQARAGVRQSELLLTRDRANLEQGLHQVNHELATSYRNLERNYEQYIAYQRTRAAAFKNVERQLADFQAGRRTLYITVLLAITDWGNAVRNENFALVQYNTNLALLEAQTGTILETHGIRFAEERYGSVGPKGWHFPKIAYPLAMPPTGNIDLPRASGDTAYKLPEVLPVPGVEEVPAPPAAVQPNTQSPAPGNAPARRTPPLPPLPEDSVPPKIEPLPPPRLKAQ